MRLLALAALAAAAVTAVPAEAAVFHVCATRLAAAGAGTTASCETQWVGPTGSSGGWNRLATAEVAAGKARLTLFCTDGYRTWSDSADVVAPGVAFLNTSDDKSCTVTLTALADGTVATATSTSNYYIHWE